jgi:TolA-binding protein
MIHVRSRTLTCLVAGLALATGTAVTPGVAHARKAAAAAAETQARPTLEEVGHAFELGRFLTGDARLAALRQADESVAALLRGDLDSRDRDAARFLAGAVRSALGDPRGAAGAYGQASGGDHDPFADDADFALIQALEAEGRDADAAREWPRWEKKHPDSPLMSEARLAESWNALRRGIPSEADHKLAALVSASTWMKSDPRVMLARAMVLERAQKPDEALAALGPRPEGPAATYLRALCLREKGALLQSAALFQETAERWPDSPLHDHALLAKANAFLAAGDFRSAHEEFVRVVPRVTDPGVKAEAELRAAGALFLTGKVDSSLALLREVTERHAGTDVAARAQLLVGEALAEQGHPAEAIVELNRLLAVYFQHGVAARAQYRVARCLDRLGRPADATGAYQAVVSGYPLEPEAPAAAYLAGTGLLTQGKPLAAAPYFQIVLDRYATTKGDGRQVVFATPAHQELVEAALCMLEMSYHRAGNLGQLSGVPHVLLGRMPPSHSPWRAYALLIDADASAAQARYPESQATLAQLMREFPDHPVSASAMKLEAWTYARQGKDSLAVAAEERLLSRFGATGDEAIVSSSFLDIAHERFNQKRYREAAAAYEDFLRRYPGHPRRLTALYQAGLCYVRLDRAGDAIDRWEAITRDSASAPLAERAWARTGDLYFQAEKYEAAERSYRGLLDHFSESSGASLAMLRLGQCEYNAGRDAAAVEGFAKTIERFPGTPAAREAQRGTELALYRLSQTAGGTQTMAKLIEQFPTSPFAADAQFQIARRAAGEKRWTDAADGFRRVVSQFPGYSAADQAQFLLADAYAHSGDTEQARQAYEQFLSFFPASALRPTVQFHLGLLQFEAKDFMRAAIAFTQVLDDSAARDVRSASLYNLALCQRQLGRTDEARASLERHRQEFPGDARAADVAYQLGDLDDAAGRSEDALKEFANAMDLGARPALAVELAFRTGRAHEQAGRPEAALRAYQQAAASTDRDNPFRLSAVARSAALYETRHEYAHALAAYQDIVRNARDRELVAAAAGRVTQLEANVRRR